jgi:hypothetical protein
MLASPNFTFATKLMRSHIPNIDRSMGASNSSKAVISGFWVWFRELPWTT